MQLQMTAPLDIGLEQSDPTLGLGQEDMFDLGHTEEDLRKTRKTKLRMDDDGDAVLESSDEEAEEEDDEPLDSEEEREKKLTGLEAELDGMYDAYQGRLRERDAKYKVQEARRKNKEREEWGGIRARGSDVEDSDAENSDDENEEGGWEKMQQAKLDDGSSSDGDSSDEDEAPRPSTSQKRSRTDKDSGPKDKKRQRLQAESSNVKPASSAAAKLWFAQDLFDGVQGLDKLSDESDDEVSADSDEETSSEAEEEEDEVRLFLTLAMRWFTRHSPLRR